MVRLGMAAIALTLLGTGASLAQEEPVSDGGAPLENTESSEAAIGQDISGVAVHSGSDQAGAAGSQGARAFATGREGTVGNGNRGSTDGMIEHELGAVLQQQSRMAEPAEEEAGDEDEVGDATRPRRPRIDPARRPHRD